MDEVKPYWWEEPKDQAHESIFGVVRFLRGNQSWIHEAHNRHQRLYGNLNVLGLSAQAYSNTAILGQNMDRFGLNIVQSMCDTVTQKIAKNRPRPMFLTEGGDWSKQKKAKQLTKFIDGMFYKTKVYAKTPKIFRDATVFGSGFVKILRKGKEISIERVFPGHVIVDETEGQEGNPRSMYQVEFIPREYAKKMWPEFADKIQSCSDAEMNMPKHKSLSNMVSVVEAWHLPANEDSKDGRHIICVDNCTMIDEVYTRDYFPLIKQDWSERLKGYMGQGLAEQLTGLQVEINKILRDIQVTMHLFKPSVLLEMGSKVVKTQINNEIGRMTWFSGTPPQIQKGEAVPAEWFAHLENLYRKSYEIAGVSAMSAQSTKPAGLNSGKALREYNDIESERFILIGQAWEELHLEIARHMIDLAQEIAEEFGNFDVMVKNQDKLEKISWKEVNMKGEEFMMQLYPTSFFSKTPSGKFQDVTELAQAGFIPKDAALKLLDFPDLESYTKYANAPQEDLYRQIELIVEHGEYHPPEPFQNLQLGVKLFQSAYLWAKTASVPEDKLEMLRRWSEEANQMVMKAGQQMADQQAQMQQGAAPQGPAMARGEVAPRNDLMPPTGV